VVGDTVALSNAAWAVVAVQSEMGSFFESSMGSLPSVAAAIRSLAGNNRSSTGNTDRAAVGPEEQSILHAAQVVNAALDGDDSVHLVEALLQGNATPAPHNVQHSPEDRASLIPSPRPVPAPRPPHEAPAPLTQLMKWLTAPVVVVLGAAGWFWSRARHDRGAVNQVISQSGNQSIR
jgi:hypothetical protein